MTSTSNETLAGSEKIDDFRAAVSDLKLRTNRQTSDTIRQVVGGILMLGGLIVGLVVYEQSLSQGSALNIASEQILVLCMLGVIVIGAALFVSATLSRFLRVWMLRQLYEGQANIDRIVTSLGNGRH